MLKLVAQDDNGIAYLIETSSIGGANVVLLNIPCEPVAAIGDLVRMNNSSVAVRALADSMSNSNVIGIIEAKPSSNVCNIRVQGVSEDIFTGLDVTKEYYLSDVDPGKMITTVPTTSGHIRLKIGQPFSTLAFLMNKSDRLIRA